MINDFTLFNFEYIKENQLEIIKELKISQKNLEKYGVFDSTKAYIYYNIFGVSSPSKHMYTIFKKVRDVVREQIPDQMIWIQSWLNYHDYNQVLGWHNHSSSWHGYISIEPQDTVTEFENWEIENECGNIYFGPGGHMHRVVNKSNYSGKRITVGFDIILERNYTGMVLPTENFGAIPLL
jgi:hypothetical protein